MVTPVGVLEPPTPQASESILGLAAALGDLSVNSPPPLSKLLETKCLVCGLPGAFCLGMRFRHLGARINSLKFLVAVLHSRSQFCQLRACREEVYNTGPTLEVFV